MKPLITLQNVRVQRGELEALFVETLSIRRGEVLALVGPNGAGKSTLLLALARLLPIQAGEIRFNGQQTAVESDTTWRRRIALVMQDPLLFDRTVYQNVAAGLQFRGIPKTEIERKVPQWLERLDVAHLAHRRAGQLSGGEAQRVSLARALVLDPELLLLDEPFSALDPPTREGLLHDLSALLRETMTTTVFVTHDLHEAAQLGSRMAVIIGGRLRQVDSPEGLFAAPADAQVAQFLGHTRGKNGR